MYSAPRMLFSYLRYWLTAANGKGHGMHSPFVFAFIRDVLNDRKKYPEYRIAEQLRAGLKRDNRLLSVDDFGAGSVTGSGRQRTVASIAAAAAKPPKYGQLLFRMLRYYQPETALELGTSLGITTHYLSLAKPDATVFTLEGAGQVAAVAAAGFQANGLDNVQLVHGNFEQTLPEILQNGFRPGFVFVDGNHRKAPTVRYFNWLLPYAGNESIFVFDDIHWSAEMESAWEEIKQHPAVTCSIDLFFVGIVVFRKEFHEKQDFKIRF